MVALPHSHSALHPAPSPSPSPSHPVYSPSLYALLGYEPDSMGTGELSAFLLGATLGSGATGKLNSVANCIAALRCIALRLKTTHTSLRWGHVCSRLYRAYRRGCRSWFEPQQWQLESLSDLPLPYVRRWFAITA